MQPREFAFFASQIALGVLRVGPAAYRSSISRSYYAAFLAARDLLTAMGFSSRAGGNEHLQVQIHFLEAGVREAQDVARRLQILHNRRKDADYEMASGLVETQRTAQFCAEQAVEVLSMIEACAKPPLFEAVQAGMAAYRKKISGGAPA